MGEESLQHMTLKRGLVTIYSRVGYKLEFALEVVQKEFFVDSHTQKVGPQNEGHTLYGRVTADLSEAYFPENSLVWSMLNDSSWTGQQPIVKTGYMEGRFQHPHNKGQSEVEGACGFQVIAT